MFMWVKQFLTGPILKDKYQTRIAEMINIILLAIFAVTVLGTIIIIPAEPEEWLFNLVFGVIVAVSILSLRQLLYQGRLTLVSVVLSTILWLSISTLIIFGGVGVSDPVFTGYFLVIAIAGLTIGGVGAIVFGALSIVAALGLLYADSIGSTIVTAGEDPPLAVNMITLTLVIGLTSMLLRFAVRTMKESLTQARKNEQAQIEANRELEKIRMTLEKRIIDRTQQLENQAKQLQAATEVGNAVTTIRDIDELLPKITQLISEQFGFYHVGIFLIDEDNEYAILQAANSEGGQQMLEEGHRLKIGEIGIIGYVTAQKEARIALDVGEDAIFFDNPYLPETRSEIALPLIVGDELLGALDVQSKQESVFSSSDFTTLEAMANQIAIAIQNALLFARHEEALQNVQRAYGERSREAWGKLLRAQPDLGFLSTATQEIRQTTGVWDWYPSMVKDTQQGDIIRIDNRTIAIPIVLREQTLGIVRLKKSEDTHPWRNNEIELMDTLIDQLETALESARLYLETQQRAERERMVTDITTKIRSTTDPDQMLKTAIDELKRALNANQAHFVIPQQENE